MAEKSKPKDGKRPNIYEDDSYESVRRRVDKRLNARREFMINIVAFTIANLVAWIMWGSGTTFGWDLAWPFLLTLPWLAGLVSHGIDVTMKPLARYHQISEIADKEMQLMYGDDWRAITHEDDYKSVHKSVRKRFNKRAEFFQNVASFVPLNFLFWQMMNNGIWFFNESLPWALIVTGIWTMAIIVHGIETFFGANDRIFQREIRKEMARLEERRAKQKRPTDEQYVRLSDDGELLDIDDSDTDDAYQADYAT